VLHMTQWMRQFTIRTRMIGVVGIVLGLLACVGAVAFCRHGAHPELRRPLRRPHFRGQRQGLARARGPGQRARGRAVAAGPVRSDGLARGARRPLAQGREITETASERSDGIGRINAAVSQLDEMTQRNASMVEQSAAAAEALTEQAGALSQLVATFRLDDGSGVRAQAVAASPT